MIFRLIYAINRPIYNTVFNSNYLFVEDVCCAVTHANLHVYDVEAAKVFVWYER